MPSYKNLAITALAAFFISPALSAPIGSSQKQSRAEVAPHPLFLLPTVPGAVPPAPEPSGGGSKRANDAPESRAIAELEGRDEHGEPAVTPKAGGSGKAKLGAAIGGGALALFAGHEYTKAHSAPPAAPPLDNSGLPPSDSGPQSSYSATPPGNNGPPPGNNGPPPGSNGPPPGSNGPPPGYNVPSSPYTAPPGSKRDNAVLLTPLSSKGLSGIHELGSIAIGHNHPGRSQDRTP